MPPSHQHPPDLRELLTRPKTDHVEEYEPEDPGLTGSRIPQGRNAKGTVLELCGLSFAQNNVPALSEYFSRYGTIVNIQVEYSGIPDVARVQFMDGREALAAANDPQAVFGSRFIKVC